MVEIEQVNRDLLLGYEEFYSLWPFLRTLPTARVADEPRLPNWGPIAPDDLESRSQRTG